MSATRLETYQAVDAALRRLTPGRPADIATVGVEACLLVIAHERGSKAAAQVAYDMADALATAGNGKDRA